MPAARDAQPTPAAGPPRAVLAVVWVTVVQAVGLTLFGVDVLVRSVRGDRSSVGSAALLVVLVLGWAVALVLAARALRAGRRAARAPLVLSELLFLAVGVPLAQGGAARWWGVVIVATAAVGVLAVLSPAVTAWTTSPDD